MEAWYFSRSETHACEAGLHASQNILDALRYALGPYIWRVKLGGTIVKDSDKAVATEHQYLWGYDATQVLFAFARREAMDVIHLWDAPDVVRRFLKTGDESLRNAAGAAAWNAAGAAARDAAWDAAGTAAWTTARDAAWVCAGDAAWDAALAATGDATLAATRKKQSRRLVQMIVKNRPTLTKP